MTHDELLAKLTDYEAHFDQVLDEEKAYDTLHAVVELHYPTSVSWANGLDYCMECSHWEGRNPELLREYPCNTIQTVEKELK